MNCHRARQLVSPYLDQQLTGREMLALQDHFAVCGSCDQEMRSLRQLKALLRGLREPAAPQGFSDGIALRLEQTPRWPVLILPAPRPQRGRRLMSALALSCFTVVSFALPFAPEARDTVRSSAFGSGSSSFGVPSPSDTMLSGRMPGIPLFSAGDLVRSSPIVSMPVTGGLSLTGMDMPAAGSSLMATRDSFGSVQTAVFRPR